MIEEISQEGGRSYAASLIEDCIRALQEPELDSHKISHIIYDLQTARSFLN